jgi:hypothetical protein
MKHKISYIILAAAIAMTACEKDPFDGIVSHERAIEALNLGGELIQVGPAQIDRENSKVSVKVLMEEGTDLSQVPLRIMTSYKASVAYTALTPLDFESTNNVRTFTVTSESGETRQWTVELIPFNEPVLGTYDVEALVVYGGTGPEYGGGEVIRMKDKSWVWPETGGPVAEEDNVLTFEFGGVTNEGVSYGNFTNNAGDDGVYADFQFVQSGYPQTDVNHFYRVMPKGTGRWEHNYTNNTITFVFDDGKRVAGKLIDAGTLNLGNGLTKVIADQAFEFILNGTDDWVNIYSDYDKFVKKPRTFWVEVKRR